MVQPPTAPLLQGHAVINGLRTHTVQPQSCRPAQVRRNPGLADHLLTAALRTRPQPRIRSLLRRITFGADDLQDPLTLLRYINVVFGHDARLHSGLKERRFGSA